MFVAGRFTAMPEHIRQPAAWFHTRILVGPGVFLTPRFAVAQNIDCVINCAYEHDSPEWFKTKYPNKYHCLNAHDRTDVNILDWFPEFEKMMLRFLRQSNGIVYVHCAAGMNRSGSLALAYVCKHFHLPFDEMLAAVRRQRPVLLQNPVFTNQVREFINGRVPSEKNTRLNVDDIYNGNFRLFTPDDRSGSEGLQNDAGNPADGIGHVADNDIRPVCEE